MLSERAQILLDDMPPYEADASDIQTIVGTCSNELSYIETTARDIQHEMYPQHATDKYGLLSLWEKLLNVPVAPPGEIDSRRQGVVIANIRGRNAGAGTEWEKRITEVLGTSDWHYREFNVALGDQPYTIYIFIPYSSTGYRSEQVKTLARRVTPAHLDLVVTYDTAFIVGESTVDTTSKIGIDVL